MQLADEGVLTLFLEGSSIATIAGACDATPVDVERSIRDALLRRQRMAGSKQVESIDDSSEIAAGMLAARGAAWRR